MFFCSNMSLYLCEKFVQCKITDYEYDFKSLYIFFSYPWGMFTVYSMFSMILCFCCIRFTHTKCSFIDGWNHHNLDLHFILWKDSIHQFILVYRGTAGLHSICLSLYRPVRSHACPSDLLLSVAGRWFEITSWYFELK